MAGMTKLERDEARLGYSLISPSLAIIGLLIIYPLVYNVYLSFFDVALSGDKTWVALRNYEKLFTAEYARAWATTIIYLLGTVGGVTLLGLVVALLLNQQFPGRNVVRTIILLPYMAPVISVIFGWQFFFGPDGLFAWFTTDILGIYDARPNLLGDPSHALWVVIVFDIWKHFPLTALMVLSRLQSIPKDLYEAAAIDGYGAWGRFWHITLPECAFVLGTVVILRFIWNFNRFEDVYLLADSVRTLPVFTYFKAFLGPTPEMGFAAAISVVQLLVLAGMMWIYVKKVLKW